MLAPTIGSNTFEECVTLRRASSLDAIALAEAEVHDYAWDTGGKRVTREPPPEPGRLKGPFAIVSARATRGYNPWYDSAIVILPTASSPMSASDDPVDSTVGGRAGASIRLRPRKPPRPQ